MHPSKHLCNTEIEFEVSWRCVSFHNNYALCQFNECKKYYLMNDDYQSMFFLICMMNKKPYDIQFQEQLKLAPLQRKLQRTSALFLNVFPLLLRLHSLLLCLPVKNNPKTKYILIFKKSNKFLGNRQFLRFFWNSARSYSTWEKWPVNFLKVISVLLSWNVCIIFFIIYLLSFFLVIYRNTNLWILNI